MTAPLDIKTSIGEEAIRIVKGARRSAYGKPEDNFERIARLWNVHLANTGREIVYNDGRGPHGLLTAIDVATFCRYIKEARLAETPDHRDSYVDIMGYAMCQAELALKPAETAEALFRFAKDGGPPEKPTVPDDPNLDAGWHYAWDRWNTIR